MAPSEPSSSSKSNDGYIDTFPEHSKSSSTSSSTNNSPRTIVSVYDMVDDSVAVEQRRHYKASLIASPLRLSATNMSNDDDNDDNNDDDDDISSNMSSNNNDSVEIRSNSNNNNDLSSTTKANNNNNNSKPSANEAASTNKPMNVNITPSVPNHLLTNTFDDGTAELHFPGDVEVCFKNQFRFEFVFFFKKK